MASPARAPPVAVRVRRPPSRVARAVMAAGRGAASTACWIAAPQGRDRGAAPSRTERARLNTSGSGTHRVSLHTRKFAVIDRFRVEPTAADAGTLSVTGRKTSPS